MSDRVYSGFQVPANLHAALDRDIRLVLDRLIEYLASADSRILSSFADALMPGMAESAKIVLLGNVHYIVEEGSPVRSKIVQLAKRRNLICMADTGPPFMSTLLESISDEMLARMSDAVIINVAAYYRVWLNDAAIIEGFSPPREPVPRCLESLKGEIERRGLNADFATRIMQMMREGEQTE